MSTRTSRLGRIIVILVTLTMLAAACADDAAETTTTAAETTTTEAATPTTELAACTVDNLNLVTPGRSTIATGDPVLPTLGDRCRRRLQRRPDGQERFRGWSRL